MISTFDALTRRSSTAEDLRQRAKEFRDEAQLRGNAITRSVNEAYDSIDVKSTAILQHVSIMIAVSGVLYTRAARSLFKYLFIGEMLLYVVLALFCLRLLMTQHISSSYDDVQNVAAKESFVDLTAKLTFLISVALVLTVIAEVTAK
jgi:H+/Cl- antiporter ClcA